MIEKNYKKIKSPSRDEVLDYLRGLAVLMVLFSHWGTLSLNPSVTAKLLHITVIPISGEQDFLMRILFYWDSLVASIWPLNINFSSGGVLIFFLVSGFVIPMSVEKYSPLSFAIRRSFRLLPTLWCVIFLVLTLNYFFYKLGYIKKGTFTSEQIMANMFLVHDWFWISHMDIGFWTLVVEVKFYIAMCAIVLLFGRITMQGIAFLMSIILFLSVPFSDIHGRSDYIELLKLSGESGYNWVFYFYRVLNNNTPYIIYMLMGTVVFMLQKKRINVRVAITSCMILFVLFATAFLIGPNGSLQLYYVDDGLKALFIFCFFIYINEVRYIKSRFKIARSFLLFFGKISYSLYLTHGLFGMSIIYGLWIWIGNINLSILIGAGLVLSITLLINKYLEEPSQLFGSRLANYVCSWSVLERSK